MKKLMIGILALSSLSAVAGMSVHSNVTVSLETQEILFLKGYTSFVTFDGDLIGNNFLRSEKDDLVLTLEATFENSDQGRKCVRKMELSKVTAGSVLDMTGTNRNPVNGLSMAKYLNTVEILRLEQNNSDRKRRCNGDDSFRSILLRLPNAPPLNP